MTQSPLAMFMNLSQLAMESNIVIGMRMMKLASGDHHAMAEAQLMISEKLETASQMLVDNSFALARGTSMAAIGASNVRTYRTAVAANQRRLSGK